MSSKFYALIPEDTLLSETFKNLRPNSRLLYIYLAVKRKGYDERFSYSYNEIRKDSRMGLHTISHAIKELVKAGLIEYDHGGLELNHNIYYMYPEWLKT